MSDKRTGKKKKKIRPEATGEPLASGQTVPNNSPNKAKKPSSGQ